MSTGTEIVNPCINGGLPWFVKESSSFAAVFFYLERFELFN